MEKRNPEQWQTLISDYEESGLTMTAFCAKQEICRKHFGKRRKQLNQKNLKSTSSFVPAALPARHDKPMLELHQGKTIVIKIPLSVSPTWLAELVHQLQVKS